MNVAAVIPFLALVTACGAGAGAAAPASASAPSTPPSTTPSTTAAEPPAAVAQKESAPKSVAATATATPTAAATAAPAHGLLIDDPGHEGAKLALDGPADAKLAENYGTVTIDGGDHFYMKVGTTTVLDLNRQDLTKGFGLTNITYATRSKTEIVYQATSRGKTAWFAEALVPVGDDNILDCRTAQSIMAPQSFTRADADAMLKACKSIKPAK